MRISLDRHREGGFESRTKLQAPALHAQAKATGARIRKGVAAGRPVGNLSKPDRQKRLKSRGLNLKPAVTL